MDNRLKTLIILVFLSLGIQQSYAQLTSDGAAGVRFGSATGFTYRHTLAPDRAIEGILSVQSNSRSSRFRLIGLYQYHKPLADDFNWYWGFGGSIGSYTGKAYTDADGNRYDKHSEMALSLDGVVGIEYNIPTTPLGISLDAKPYFDFLQESRMRLFDAFGLSIRYKF